MLPAAAPVTQQPTVLSHDELTEGWIALFDGATLFGWAASNKANWRVEDGTIVVDDGEQGLLCTTTEFSDYVLHVEFRSAPGTNSGIFLHTPLKPQDPGADCYELNIADSDNPFPTCSLVKRMKAEGNFDSADWQTYDVTVLGGKVTINLDSKQILEYTDPQPLRRGHIGLQLNQGKVEFRNIKLRPLSMTSLFNGTDLTGWKEYPDMASKFTVTGDGLLNVKNGRGQLETEGSYGDFVLQLECMTHAPQLNSGFFFRCIPGSPMNGYESQIHNGFKDGDRSQPVDCGTGGIFRRVNARLVVANDEEWFYKTVVADGAHVSTWVNGYQVVDWVDDRAPDENPRNGLRLEAGTIMIQGHDPTTDISFRNIQIAELAGRNNPTQTGPQ
ncbi:MAG: DUF1080 domain-containing protein [Planctomycetaceae bacterium]|nr:DUF1080 domain-containing protein [Planctomycetales bacterium]MCB9920745.1 DUF1080 domain-containing protein [Planctomycetaceae bacterium]